MANQTTYVQNQPVGAVGALVNGEVFNAISRVCTAEVLFGAPAQRSGDMQCAPFASSGEYIGVARRSMHSPQGDRYSQYETAGLVDEGVIWGVADAAITVGAGLNFNVTSGRWTTASTSGTVLAVPGSEADSAASGAGVLFKVRLRRVPS